MIERVGRFTIDCAPDDTRRQYGARASGGSEACGCLYCRNFAEARPVIFSESLQAQLDQLGIDWHKEDDADEFGLLNSGLRLYVPCFSFAGRVVEVGEEDGESELQLSATGPMLELSVKLEVPWVLSDEEPNW